MNEEKNKWLCLVSEKYARRELRLAFRYGNKEDMKIAYEKLQKQNSVTKTDMEYYEASLSVLKWYYLKTKVNLGKIKKRIMG